MCHLRGGTINEAMARLENAQHHPNMLAKYDYAGVCPRTVAQEISTEFIQSVPWYDKGSLGIPFHRVPAWYKIAVNIFEASRNKASAIMAEEPR